MATARQAISGVWNAGISITNAVTTTASAVDFGAQVIASYAREMAHERNIEEAVNAASLQQRVVENSAMAMVENRLQIVQWIGNDPTKKEMYETAISEINARLK